MMMWPVAWDPVEHSSFEPGNWTYLQWYVHGQSWLRAIECSFGIGYRLFLVKTSANGKPTPAHAQFFPSSAFRSKKVERVYG